MHCTHYAISHIRDTKQARRIEYYECTMHKRRSNDHCQDHNKMSSNVRASKLDRCDHRKLVSWMQRLLICLWYVYTNTDTHTDARVRDIIRWYVSRSIAVPCTLYCQYDCRKYRSMASFSKNITQPAYYNKYISSATCLITVNLVMCMLSYIYSTL